jgi:early secretory antigenic target protein ESAT-6
MSPAPGHAPATLLASEESPKRGFITKGATMTQYHVDSSEISRGSQLAIQSGENIRMEVAGLLGMLTSLEGSWQGGAASAFTGVLEQWRSAQAQVETALGSMGAALGQAAQEYEAAETQASRLFAR